MERLFLLLTLILTIGTVNPAFSQSPYAFDWKKETLISGLGLTTWGSSYIVADQVEPYSLDQLSVMDRSSVIGFDRFATYNYSLEAQKVSDVLSLGSKLVPLAFLAGKKTRNDFASIAVLYAETFLVSNGVTTLTKSAVARPRPFVFNEAIPVEEKTGLGARRSFISGHTSKTAAMTFFTAKVYADYHPDSKWRPFVWTAAAAIPAVTGFMRVKGGKHYPTDVIVGYAVGAASGFLVPHLHKKNRGKKDKNKADVNINVGPAGASLSMTF